MKTRFYIIDLDTGDKFGPFCDSWSAKGKAKNSGMRCAVVDDMNVVLCGYTTRGEEIEPKEAVAQ